jgi:hypothetical protein
MAEQFRFEGIGPDIADEIADSMDDNPSPEELMKMAEEISRQIKIYSPFIETHLPKIIKECGPAYRAVLKSAIEELMPIMVPYVQQEARIIAKEMVSEYFAQLRDYNKDQLRQFPETMAEIAKAINTIK